MITKEYLTDIDKIIHSPGFFQYMNDLAKYMNLVLDHRRVSIDWDAYDYGGSQEAWNDASDYLCETERALHEAISNDDADSIGVFASDLIELYNTEYRNSDIENSPELADLMGRIVQYEQQLEIKDILDSGKELRSEILDGNVKPCLPTSQI